MSGVRLHSYDMLWHICWLALAAPATVITVYVVCALTYTQIRWHQWLRDVPGPARETWLMGNLRTFMYRDIGAVCRAWTQTFGGAVRFWGTFGEPRLMLMDPVAFDYVFRKRAYAFPKMRISQRLIASFMGNGLIVSEGMDHRRQRRAIQPGFQARNIKRLAPVFQEHVYDAMDYLDTCLQRSETALVDMYATMSAATLDALGDGALGVKFRTLASLRSDPNGAVCEAHPLTAALERAQFIASHPGWFTVMVDILSMYFPALEHIPVGLSSRAFRRATRVLFDLAGKVVDDAKARIKAGEPSPDILSALLRANANAERDAEEKRSILDRNVLTDAELHAQVSTFIFAGHETTSTQLAWLFLFLAQDQTRQQTLRRAIVGKRASLGLAPQAGSTGDRALSEEELDDIPYLDWCIRECLRLQSAVHTTSRVATETEWIPLSNRKHVQVHPGMVLLFPLSAFMTSEAYWGPEPDAFRPERWSEPLPGRSVIPAHHGLSFLMGPRACIGSSFAILEMKVFIASILPSFQFEWDGRPIVPKMWPVARPLDVQRGVDACVLQIRRISRSGE